MESVRASAVRASLARAMFRPALAASEPCTPKGSPLACRQTIEGRNYELCSFAEISRRLTPSRQHVRQTLREAGARFPALFELAEEVNTEAGDRQGGRILPMRWTQQILEIVYIIRG
jgi:hypothetical protein